MRVIQCDGCGKVVYFDADAMKDAVHVQLSDVGGDASFEEHWDLCGDCLKKVHEVLPWERPK